VKFRLPSPSLVLSIVALFVALGGGAAFAATQIVTNAKRLGGHPASWYLPAKHVVSSGGEHFLRVGQTKVLGRAGHYTFSSSCTDPSGVTGAQQVTFDVTANTTADLDGNGPMPAGTKINIHTDSDARNTTPDNPLNAGDFTQVGSASDSTEIGADGQEVDVFYNDGVNWPAGNGSPAHDCFAGYTGFLG
jgi:hypothetical protein